MLIVGIVYYKIVSNENLSTDMYANSQLFYSSCSKLS